MKRGYVAAHRIAEATAEKQTRARVAELVDKIELLDIMSSTAWSSRFVRKNG